MDPSTLKLELRAPVVVRDEERWLAADVYQELCISPVALGSMQLEWIDRFDFIQLDEWRYWCKIYITTRTQWTGWVYVGEWSREGTTTRKQYEQRARRLNRDFYCYWPPAERLV